MGYMTRKFQKYPQYCWEFHDRLWEAPSGTTSEKRSDPGRTGGERILETLWKPQTPWIIGFGASQPYSRGKFQETLWERFRGLSGIFPEFLPESPSRTGGMAQQKRTRGEFLQFFLPSPHEAAVLPSVIVAENICVSPIRMSSSPEVLGLDGGFSREKALPWSWWPSCVGESSVSRSPPAVA